MRNNKEKLLVLLEYLKNYSDEDHPVRMNDIIDYLNANSIDAERKSVYRDIKCLNDLGYEIFYTTTPSRGYILTSKSFTAVEAKILYDAINSTTFITKKKSEEISQKILDSVSVHDAKLILSLSSNLPKSQNEHIYYSIDAILQAIQKNVAIEFKYFDILPNKQKQYRKQASSYHLIPYALLLRNQKYYCVLYSTKHEGFANYRVDRMDSIRVTEEKVHKIPFDLNTYAETSFSMFSGKVESVTLLIKNELISYLFDEFGDTIMIQETTKDKTRVIIKTTISNTFIGWLLQFTDNVQVLKPQSLIQQIKETTAKMHQLYGGD